MNDENLAAQVLSGRYRLLRSVASGGMARVYVAEDLRLQRQVAVKIVHAHLAEDPSFIEKFDREAVMAARVNHPNLVNVFDQGVDGNKHYLVMEYVPGETLREVMKKLGPLDASKALEVLKSVLAGLAAAHKAGIIHRDIKPENVLLADDGRIKLSDFGLARPVSAATQTESVLGTAAYLSPELVTRGLTDARSDVYAVGILLYELVTGRQPYAGESAAHIAAQHASSKVAKPSEVNPGVPAIIDELVLYATEREPNARPSDADAFLNLIHRAELELAGGNQTTRIRPTSPPINQTTVLEPVTDSNATMVLGGKANQTELISPASGAAETQNPLEEFEQRRPFIRWMIATTVAVLVGITAGWWFGVGPGALRSVPDSVGRRATQVESTLHNLGLEIKVIEEFSPSVDAGLVTHTNPSSGALVFPGSSIQVFVSKGPVTRAVPDLHGLDVATATQKIIESGFAFGGVSAWFNDSAVGTVFDYDGADGSKRSAGSSIAVKLSLGPIPVVASVPLDAAKLALQTAGLKIGVTSTEYSETVTAGNVIKLIPQSEPLGQNGTVDLIVSKGSQNVTMPKVVGETIAAAKTLLESLGLKVVVDTNQLTSRWGIAKVKSASVSVGSVIKKGSSVTIISR